MDLLRQKLIEYNQRIDFLEIQLIKRDNKINLLEKQIDNKSSFANMIRGELDRINALANERMLIIEQLNNNINEIETKLTQIEGSTFWRVSTPFRSILARAPKQQRMQLRRVIKALWWMMTLHRMPSRLRFLLQRQASEGRKKEALNELADVNSVSNTSKVSLSTQRFELWFDAGWYLEQNPDLAIQEVDPFEHYCKYGWREGRSPHPLFDVEWYLQHHSNLIQEGVNPLVHFLESLEDSSIIYKSFDKNESSA